MGGNEGLATPRGVGGVRGWQLLGLWGGSEGLAPTRGVCGGE